jgi:Spy/CpxP family protein refolding chaperone
MRLGAPEAPTLLLPFVRLSERQQDRLFELLNAHEPALRAQFEALASAQDELRALALAESFDEARVRPIVARAAQANSEIDLLHARLQHAALALLTPEQRRRLDECKPGAEGPSHRGCPSLR